jgi:hypothetical protein
MAVELRYLVTLIVFACLAFGGTFTCDSRDDDINASIRECPQLIRL